MVCFGKISEQEMYHSLYGRHIVCLGATQQIWQFLVKITLIWTLVKAITSNVCNSVLEICKTLSEFLPNKSGILVNGLLDIFKKIKLVKLKNADFVIAEILLSLSTKLRKDGKTLNHF